MTKNYLYQIVNLQLAKMPEGSMSQCIEWFYQESPEVVRQELKSLNLSSDLVTINKNERACFISKIIHFFKEKCPTFVETLEHEEAKKVNLISNRFGTKLAKEEEKVERNILNDEFKLELPFSSLRKKKEPEEVEENSFTIPALKMPSNEKENEVEEYEENHLKVEEEEVETLQFKELSKEELIQSLKNTKIELPAKFKNKEDPEVQKEAKVIEELVVQS